MISRRHDKLKRAITRAAKGEKRDAERALIANVRNALGFRRALARVRRRRG